MNYIALENSLKTRMKKRRIIELFVCAVFFAILIAFAVLYEKSKVIEDIGLGPITHHSVRYNHNFVWGIMVGIWGLIPAVIVWISDCLFSKLVTIEINGDYITFYRGFAHTSLYINGVQKESITYGYYMEATLPDRSKVNVALGKWSAHLTFTNGHPPVDV